MRELLEELLKLDTYVVVITGTNFSNIDRQFSAAIRGPHKRNLYVCTNRGSEVYSFDAESNPVRVWARIATPEEDRLLTETADALRNAIASRTGLDIRVIYDRMNRRKVDLIPLPEWEDPPKSAIGELQQAVEARLKGAGLAGGLREAFTLAEQISREKGLRDARITSDVKHIEVGLTDKSDAIDWMMRELAQKQDIAPHDILIAGDEFGPVAGFEGSDYKMVAPSAAGAAFASVGPEPNDVPSEVLHIGGGPARFCDLVACQIALHEQLHREAARCSSGLPATPTEDPAWLLIEDGFNLAREHEVEALFTVANGYLGTRGALPERSGLSSPATYVAGVFDVEPQTGSVPELVLTPDWTRWRITVDGQELLLDKGEFLEHRRVLDLRKGIFFREWRHRDPAGRVTCLRFLRLASLADRHVLVQSGAITPENYSGHITLEAIIERPVSGRNVYSPAIRELTPPTPELMPSNGPTTVQEAGLSETSGRPAPVALSLRTQTRGTTVALAAASELRTEDMGTVKRELGAGEGYIVSRWDWEAEIGKSYRLDRLVSVYTSRDTEQPTEAAAGHLERLLTENIAKAVEDIVGAHVSAWESRWQAADVEVEGDEEVQRALRFAIYHLISSANPEDERASIGARGLTGSVYKGHVFWDTEAYMLPFYTFTHPPSARALLMYRYHTLPAARAKARSLGYRGALYAWESADTGEETTPPFVLSPDGKVIPILTGEQEHHISADVAYAAWQYWQATVDDAFFLNAGAEIIMETARFWASRGQMEEDGCYHIRLVIGPDEYHEAVNDNAYTNAMAQWNLERGEETARILKERWPERWQQLAERMDIGPEEPQEWLNLARVFYTGFDPKSGIFEQFTGCFRLETIDLAEYEGRTVPMDVLLGWERIQRARVIKQADVVMLIYLLWDRFSPEVREANFRYYEPCTGHGSSLSPSVHALVAARLGDLRLAERYFKQAATIDLARDTGAAAGGVHSAAQGGLWQAAVFGFGGVQPGPDGLTFDPHLLPRWRRLRFRVQWRGRKLTVTLDRNAPEVEIRTEGEGPTIVSGEQPAVRQEPKA
ncbi:MAG: glycoside hydrolase family 65 [Chloroflexi bacterium]|nr:glycoside hydrolase family 65 [Chloroflexota bacterium]